MWARHMELALGLWLLVSPFVFRHEAQSAEFWRNDLICGSLVVLLPTLAYWRRTYRAHLVLLLVSGWLIGAGWWAAWQSSHPLPAHQNWLIVGLLLGILAVVPNDASKPPTSWRKARLKELDRSPKS
jgi:hypothetical protein